MKSDNNPILRIRMSIRNPIPTRIRQFRRNLLYNSIGFLSNVVGSDCPNDSPGVENAVRNHQS